MEEALSYSYKRSLYLPVIKSPACAHAIISFICVLTSAKSTMALLYLPVQATALTTNALPSNQDLPGANPMMCPQARQFRDSEVLQLSILPEIINSSK
jgi:hypothetical protein